jgi:hypothetical protein
MYQHSHQSEAGEVDTALRDRDARKLKWGCATLKGWWGSVQAGLCALKVGGQAGSGQCGDLGKLVAREQ